ncbi:MAG: amino acid ABC transporter substrate-binding protein [Betaproteobacteria bacterium]|nr:amino acid ABC transporter substrate-binding protein [Betaproteobacteria bacterium]
MLRSKTYSSIHYGDVHAATQASDGGLRSRRDPYRIPGSRPTETADQSRRHSSNDRTARCRRAHVRTGIDIAVDSINAQGGVNGSRIELVVEDDKFTPQESVLMFRKHAGQGVVVVLGPISSSSWENVSPLAPRISLPVISFTFTFKEGVPNGEWAMGVSPDERTMLPEAFDEFVKLHPNVKKVVIAADIKQASGAAAIPIFQAAAKKHGVQVLDVIEFETATTDFAPIITRAKSKTPDAILSAGVPPSVIAMTRELGSQKVDVPLFNNGMIWPGAFPQAAGPGFEKIYTVVFSTNEKLQKTRGMTRTPRRFKPS